MKIYIIRHGETDLNVKKVLQGGFDEPLNYNGRQLASVTGKALRGIHFDRCISSPLIRAVETVSIILKESGNDTQILCDDRIREISFGVMDGRPLSETGENGRLFFSDPFSFPGFPEGETIKQVCSRTQDFLKELIARDDGLTYLIGIHGCALRAMLNFLYEDPENFWHGHVPYNCAVNIVEASGGKASLIVDDKIYYKRK